MPRSNISLNTSRSIAARANVAASSATRQAVHQGYAGGGSCRGGAHHQYDRTTLSSLERDDPKADRKDEDDDDAEKASGRCTPIPRGAGPEPFEYPSNSEGTMATIKFHGNGSTSYRVLTTRNGDSTLPPLTMSGTAFVGGRVVRPSSSVRGPGAAKPHRFVIAATSPPVPPSLAARRRQVQQHHKTCAKIVVTPPSPVMATAISNRAS